MSVGPSKVPATVANGRFEITEKLGAGCFGTVYRGIDTQTKAHVAVKFESFNSPAPQLENEAQVLGQLRSTVQPQGIAEAFYFGKERSMYCLVMEALGYTVDDRQKACGGHFSLKTVALIADQALRRIEYLHSKCLVHRDIKPENFVFGVQGRRHHLYLIDFGLAKRYFAQRKHAQLRQTPSLTGTARYASLNAHRGIEQSRRDDLEAIGYMLIYLLKGSMPWSGLEARSKHEKYRRIKESKESTRVSDLCKGSAEEFETYLKYCRNLLYSERPDYDKLRGLFISIRQRLEKQRGGRCIEDHHLDWLDGKASGYTKGDEIVPLSLHLPLQQPDDEASSRAKVSWKSLCACGGKVAVQD